MLILKRVQTFNECEKDMITGDLITWGEYYFEDSDDGFIIGRSTYYNLKRKYDEEKFDYSRLEKADNERIYKDELEKAEREYNTATLFERKIYRGGKVGHSEKSIPN